jgi:uncharacterized protein YndB with AHSA1/START domain
VSPKEETMNAEPIIVEQTFRASIARVWDAISIKDQMRKWFFESINAGKAAGVVYTWNLRSG